MSLLSVTVKKARYVGIQATQFNTYVTLKLQNVKSTTVTVKGPTPSWEQDFLFEINDINLGLLVEVWNKGVIWDRALGYHYLPLTSVAYDEQECGGQWVELEAQLIMRGGAVVGTTGPTGHALLLDCRFEPPFDAEGTGGADLQRKLDLLNGALGVERAEQARRQLQYVAHSGYSEDSDYTSDLNFPLGQHANCSASQFRNAAHQMHTPQRSLEVSRENSYERDEYHLHADTDPLYYNSQPRTNRIETWSQLHAQASVESAISWRTAADWQSGEEQRRPSLERQNTLYDDSLGYGYDPYTTSTHIRDHTHLSQQPSYEEYFDSSSYPYPAYEPPWEGQYFFVECGLTPTEYENIINKRRSSVVQLPQMPPKQLPPSSRYSDHNEMAPYRPWPRRTAASLPATPSSTPKRGRALPVPPGSDSGWGRRGRRLPRPPAVTATTRLQPTPPVAAHTHVPYIQEPEKMVPDVSCYGYDSFRYQQQSQQQQQQQRQQQQYQDTAIDQYQDTNYNSSSYDEEGMQPFFDETPHATPPATQAQKKTWAETDSSTQVTSSDETVIEKPVKSKITSYIQPPVTTNQDVTHLFHTTQQEQNYDLYGLNKYEDKQQYQKFDQQEQSYQESQNIYLDQKSDRHLQYQYETKYEDEQDFSEKQQFNLQYEQHDYQQQQDIHSGQQDQKYFHSQHLYQEEQQYQPQHDNYQQQQQDYTQQQQKDYQQQQQEQYEKQDIYHQEQQQEYLHRQQEQQLQQQTLLQQQQQTAQRQQQQQQQQQQQKLPAQQLQSSVLTGAATLGSFMAGGAKRLGNFFGAAAAAVAAPSASQQQQQQQQQLLQQQQKLQPQPPSVSVSSVHVTHIESTLSSTYEPASVTQFSYALTVSDATSVPVSDSSSVPITSVTTSTPSLPRTPSLKRQDSMQRPPVRRTRTLPDAPEDYPTGSFDESAYEDEYNKTELDQVDRERTSLDRYRDEDYAHDTIHEDVAEEAKAVENTSLSIQKTASPTKTVSQVRKPSVDSYHSQTPSVLDRKTSQSSFISQHEDKLTIPTSLEEQITDKTKVTFHEVPDEQDRFERQESFDQDNDYQDDQDQDETFREDEKFQEHERFDQQYPEDSVFNQEQDRHEEEQMVFQPEQPKLTPKQRWHRAYNKIVMQLNVSTL